jgi:hypothetical protein
MGRAPRVASQARQRHQAHAAASGADQRAQVSAFWAMILGRFRDYLHMTATLNEDLHSTQGGPDDIGQ